MKFLPSQILYLLQNKNSRRNITLLGRFFIFLAAIVTLYSILFHGIMVFEGRNFSWITGFYWTLTVMSTLGFGDITFSTDLGKFFTLLVLLSGIVFLLIMLPFTFIQFFYEPWLEAQNKSRTPRKLPQGTAGHIILTNLDPVTEKLIQKLDKYNYSYVLILSDIHTALDLQDSGYKVVVGDVDDPKTYERIQVQDAALVVATENDLISTNIAFTIREISDSVPIVTNADNANSIDILEFPGNMYVLQFMKMLGESLALRTLSSHQKTNVIGRFDALVIAETLAKQTRLVGSSLAEIRVREMTGTTVVGLWEKGKFKPPFPQTTIRSNTILVLAGTEEQIDRFDEKYTIQCEEYDKDAPVLILGGGRVGESAADVFRQTGVPYRIVEKRPVLVKEKEEGIYIQGDAADINTLKKAGIEMARAVIITTHNDDMNIYLTFYCRQLRPDIQILTRSTVERSVPKLHMAGADLVSSYASLGANSIISILKPSDVSMFTEGLNIFNRLVRSPLSGKSLAESKIREKTGCSVIAIRSKGQTNVGYDPLTPLKKDDELILIATTEAEEAYAELFD